MNRDVGNCGSWKPRLPRARETRRKAIWAAALYFVAIGLARACDQCSSAAEEETRNQWQARVEEARKRTEEFVRKVKSRDFDQEPMQESEEQIKDRLLNDATLQEGDIVTTTKRMYRYEAPRLEEGTGRFLPLNTQ